jgi:hypothetical protein
MRRRMGRERPCPISFTWRLSVYVILNGGFPESATALGVPGVQEEGVGINLLAPISARPDAASRQRNVCPPTEFRQRHDREHPKVIPDIEILRWAAVSQLASMRSWSGNSFSIQDTTPGLGPAGLQ